MYGQMTAGSWIYIGTQGILQGTYETFAAVAGITTAADLAGGWCHRGLGGMGGAQPLAVTMAGGVLLCVEVDPLRIKRRLETGYVDCSTESLDEALRWAAARDPTVASRSRSACWATPPTSTPSSCGAASCPTWSPTRPRLTTP